MNDISGWLHIFWGILSLWTPTRMSPSCQWSHDHPRSLETRDDIIDRLTPTAYIRLSSQLHDPEGDSRARAKLAPFQWRSGGSPSAGTQHGVHLRSVKYYDDARWCPAARPPSAHSSTATVDVFSSSPKVNMALSAVSLAAQSLGGLTSPEVVTRRTNSKVLGSQPVRIMNTWNHKQNRHFCQLSCSMSCPLRCIQTPREDYVRARDVPCAWPMRLPAAQIRRWGKLSHWTRWVCRHHGQQAVSDVVIFHATFHLRAAWATLVPPRPRDPVTLPALSKPVMRSRSRQHNMYNLGSLLTLWSQKLCSFVACMGFSGFSSNRGLCPCSRKRPAETCGLWASATCNLVASPSRLGSVSQSMVSMRAPLTPLETYTTAWSSVFSRGNSVQTPAPESTDNTKIFPVLPTLFLADGWIHAHIWLIAPIKPTPHQPTDSPQRIRRAWQSAAPCVHTWNGQDPSVATWQHPFVTLRCLICLVSASAAESFALLLVGVQRCCVRSVVSTSVWHALLLQSDTEILISFGGVVECPSTKLQLSLLVPPTSPTHGVRFGWFWHVSWHCSMSSVARQDPAPLHAESEVSSHSVLGGAFPFFDGARAHKSSRLSHSACLLQFFSQTNELSLDECGMKMCRSFVATGCTQVVLSGWRLESERNNKMRRSETDIQIQT